MDAKTGKPLGGVEHLRQSIRDILTTPIGTRGMLREYGSRLFELIDAPTNRSTLLAIYAATIEAIERWEPRIKITRVFATAAEPGAVTLSIVGTYLPDGREISFDGIVVN